MKYEPHPLAEEFPSMSKSRFQELCDDIKENGLNDPIVLYEGQILDGRHRYLACLEISVEPHFDTYNGSDPVAFVKSRNMHRRHLTKKEQDDLISKYSAKVTTKNGRPKKSVAGATVSKFTNDDAANEAGVHRATLYRRKQNIEVVGPAVDKFIKEFEEYGIALPQNVGEVKKRISGVSEGSADRIMKKIRGDVSRSEKNAAKTVSIDSQQISIEKPKDEAAMSAPVKVELPVAPVAADTSDNEKKLQKKIDKLTAENREMKKRVAECEEIAAAHKDFLEYAYNLMISDVEAMVRFYNTYRPGGVADRTAFTQEDYNTVVKALHPDKVARTGDSTLIAEHGAAFNIFKNKKAMLIRPEKTEEQSKSFTAPSASEALASYLANPRHKKDPKYRERMEFMFPHAIVEQIVTKSRLTNT